MRTQHCLPLAPPPPDRATSPLPDPFRPSASPPHLSCAGHKPSPPASADLAWLERLRGEEHQAATGLRAPLRHAITSQLRRASPPPASAHHRVMTSRPETPDQQDLARSTPPPSAPHHQHRTTTRRIRPEQPRIHPPTPAKRATTPDLPAPTDGSPLPRERRHKGAPPPPSLGHARLRRRRLRRRRSGWG